jgi:multiple sugar transport system substrate-binding protein
MSLGDGLKSALEYQNKLTNTLKVAPPPSSGNTVSDLFAAGKAAMAMNGDWMIGSYRDVDFNWDIAPLPAAPGASTGYDSLHTGFYAISSTSKNKDAAWKFIGYMMSDPGQKAAQEFGGSSSALKTIQAKGYNHIAGTHGPSDWDALTAAFDEGRFGYTTVNSAVYTDLTNQFSAYLLGSTTLDDIFDTDIPKANSDLAEDQ